MFFNAYRRLKGVLIWVPSWHCRYSRCALDKVRGVEMLDNGGVLMYWPGHVQWHMRRGGSDFSGIAEADQATPTEGRA